MSHQPVTGDQLIKIVVILCIGMVATLLFTAQTAVVIRNLVRTENKEVRCGSRWRAPLRLVDYFH
jgi:hypothetical protein